MSSTLRYRNRSNVSQQIFPSSEDAGNKTKEVILDIKGELLLLWHELPEWSKDNEYIRGGHRPISNSYKRCFESCLHLHNETGNIYSHLLAMVWMLVLPPLLYQKGQKLELNITAEDVIVFGFCFVCGAICFGMSTLYHILASHSQTTYETCHKLDFLGIITICTGCFLPGLWYTFPCMQQRQKLSIIAVRPSVEA